MGSIDATGSAPTAAQPRCNLTSSLANLSSVSVSKTSASIQIYGGSLHLEECGT